MTLKTKKDIKTKKDFSFYVVSYAAQDQMYSDWAHDDKGLHIQTSVLVKGGANVIDKVSLQAEKGIITPITKEEKEFLEQNAAFIRHAERGFVKILVKEKEAKAEIENNDEAPVDNGSQLTAADFESRGLKPPVIASK